MRVLDAQNAAPHLAPLAGRGRIALAIRVRGSLRERGRDYFKHTRHIAQHIVIPESQNTVIAFDKPFVAHGIALAVSMLPAINLDDKPTFSANEIDDIETYRLLPDEFVTSQTPRSQSAPKRVFRICRGPSQAPSAPCPSLFCTAHAARPPHPDCFAIRPLPARGERLASREAA
jgi:hypothetical protein